MKPGVLVALVVPSEGAPRVRAAEVYLGVLDQPVIFGDERRWSVSWLDGVKDSGTWPEDWLRRVVR